MNDEPIREFVLSAGDFRRVQALIKARVGIDLGSNKQSLVYGRLARRLRALGMHAFTDYLALVEDPRPTRRRASSTPSPPTSPSSFARTLLRRSHQAGLVRRYRQLLGDGGYLLLGHSESMVGSTSGFESCGLTIYRRDGS